MSRATTLRELCPMMLKKSNCGTLAEDISRSILSAGAEVESHMPAPAVRDPQDACIDPSPSEAALALPELRLVPTALETQRDYPDVLSEEARAQRRVHDARFRLGIVDRQPTPAELANDAYCQYLAGQSAPRKRAFRKALLAVAFNISKHMTSDESKQENVAVHHCLTQLSQGKYQPKEYKGRVLPFTAWAIPVMRNKMKDIQRKIWAAEKRRHKLAAKHAREEAERWRIARKRRRFEFTREQIASIQKRLKLKQSQLLKLKRQGVPNREISEKLNLTYPQLHNRWSRLRRKIRGVLESNANRESLFKPRRARWYPGAETLQPIIPRQK